MPSRIPLYRVEHTLSARYIWNPRRMCGIHGHRAHAQPSCPACAMPMQHPTSVLRSVVFQREPESLFPYLHLPSDGLASDGLSVVGLSACLLLYLHHRRNSAVFSAFSAFQKSPCPMSFASVQVPLCCPPLPTDRAGAHHKSIRRRSRHGRRACL